MNLPAIENEARPRRQARFPRPSHLLWAAALGTAATWYLMLIPLEFHALSLDHAVARFADLPVYSIEASGRADLVANIAIFVPLGFLWIGAFDLDRRSRWPAVALAPAIAFMLVAVAVAMEFTQIWFPPRTISFNDIWAEIGGGVAGIVAWFVVGRAMIHWLRGIFDPANVGLERRRVFQAYTLALLLYSLVPFDVTLHISELVQKVHEGRIVLVPFSRGWGGVLGTVLHVAKNVIYFLPVGVMFRMGWDHDRTSRRTLWHAARLCLVLALAIEFAQLFIFTARSDVAEAVLAGLGGWLGAWLAPQWFNDDGEFMLGKSLDAHRRQRIAIGLASICALAVIAVRWWPLRFIHDPVIILEHARYFLSWPFENYYFAGEWSALIKMVSLVLAFFPIGAAMRWRKGVSTRQAGWKLALAVAVALGLLIGLGQAAVLRAATFQPSHQEDAQHIDYNSPPHYLLTDAQARTERWLRVGPIPDITDCGAYVAGATLGWVVMGVFLLQSNRATPAPRPGPPPGSRRPA